MIYQLPNEKKVCNRCKLELPLTAYGWKDDVRRAICQKCHMKAQRLRQNQEHQYAQRMKVKLGCASCGYNEYAAALDFHHIDEATKKVQIAHRSRLSWKKLRSELKKCVVLCARCHRELHVGVYSSDKLKEIFSKRITENEQLSLL